MGEKVIKLGVVGLRRGMHVTDTIIGDKNAVVRAICDKNSERVESTRKYFTEERNVENLLCFDNFEDMLKSDIDAVFVATDATCHVPYVIQAMEAGKHVLSEIPTVTSVEEAKRLKAAVKAHPELKYMTGENCCYWAFIEAWKRMHEEGKFGDIIYAEGEYLHKLGEDLCSDGSWRKHQPAINYITHELGPLLYIMDDKCVSVSCMEPDIKFNPPYRDAPANGVALFRTEKGAVIRVFICFGAYVGIDHNFSLYGTAGMITTDRTKSLETAHSFASFSDIPGSAEEKIDIPVTMKFAGESVIGGHGGADAKMIKAFVECIINDTNPPIDVDMGIRMSLPGVIAHESALQGGAVLEIPEI